MKFYDVTMSIHESMMVYKDKAEKKPVFNTSTNGHVTETKITMDAHTGTHIDSPLHMINEGDTFETIPLDRFITKCKVLDLTTVEDGITARHLEPFEIEQNDFLVLKTTNSFHEKNEFDHEFVYLKEDGAKYLIDKGIKGVATDGLGIERSQPDHGTHRSLFKEKIVIMEGFSLKDVPQGEYLMIAAPIKVTGIEAAPARVFLVEGMEDIDVQFA
ncbi:cyclase family protein [Priestia endophytica]|jgi:arylformamidase|uniref:cyclase family protein n=1 Tax=Priestia endophytica TaxID=135735 RepID=UPI000DCA6B35|nr:cyclase family protein [Priestia endophytica]RAS86712.1 cyclase [Priestia endophytica]